MTVELMGRVPPVPMRAQPGDVFLTRSRSWLGRAIRVMTRSPGEAPTRYNHAGIIVSASITWGDALVVEALGAGVVKRRLMAGYLKGGDPRIAVWRYEGERASECQAEAATRASARVGQRYGYLKLLLHAGDWLTTGGRFRLFRRLGRVDRWPICSQVVADAWRMRNASSVQPDDLDDLFEAAPDWCRVL